MKAVVLGVVMAITSTLAYAEDDVVELISRYRHAHGLSTVKTDPQLTAVAERQAKAMAASGIMDHSVAGSFTSRLAGVPRGMAAENIAAGTKTWAETFRMWQNSPGHNANLLQSKADIVGVAVARNEQTRYKTYWAMAIAEKPIAEKPAAEKPIAEKPSKKKAPKTTEKPATEARTTDERKTAEHQESAGGSQNPLSTIKDFVCKYLC